MRARLPNVKNAYLVNIQTKITNRCTTIVTATRSQWQASQKMPLQGMHVCMHGQMNEPVKNIMPLVAHRMGSGGTKTEINAKCIKLL